MSDIDQLRKEILRLEAILDEHGIDHEPEQFGPPGRPMMGPPTRIEYATQVTVNRLVDVVEAQLLGPSPLRDKLSRDYAGIGSTPRVRLPVDFTVYQ